MGIHIDVGFGQGHGLRTELTVAETDEGQHQIYLGTLLVLQQCSQNS